MCRNMHFGLSLGCVVFRGGKSEHQVLMLRRFVCYIFEMISTRISLSLVPRKRTCSHLIHIAFVRHRGPNAVV
jgi:hypothetical protein